MIKNNPTPFTKTNRFGLYLGRVIEVKQELGKHENKKFLLCKIEMSQGGIIDHVPFFAGGMDFETKFPHGSFIPPRMNQMVGILFYKGKYDNPVACFPLPLPPWTLNETQAGELYNNIMESVNDIGLYHFSGSRILLRESGEIEIGQMIAENEDSDPEMYSVIVKFTKDDILITDKALNEIRLTSKQNEEAILVTDKNGNNILMDKNGTTVTDKDGNKITMSSDGILLEDKNSNKISMESGKVVVNGGNLEVLQ